MLVQPDAEAAQAYWDTLSSLCGETEFAELVERLVALETPRLFAVVQEFGKRVDGRVAAWGMAFPDHADVVEVDRGSHVRLRSPELAAHKFCCPPRITARVVWVNPDPAGPGRQ